jgi:hypothetical protein
LKRRRHQAGSASPFIEGTAFRIHRLAGRVPSGARHHQQNRQRGSSARAGSLAHHGGIVMQLRPISPRMALAGSFAAMLLAAVSAGAQTSTHVGMRVGYNFRTEEALFSGNLTVPMTNRIEFYPSIDIYTPNTGNRMGFNGDVKLTFPTNPGPQFYVGGGVGIVNRNQRNVSNTDIGANLLMGLESRTGWIHPFGEAKVLIHDRTQFQLIGGLNLTIGR